MNAPQTKEQAIAVIRQGREDILRAQRSLEHVLLGAGYIVKLGQIYITFDVNNKVATNGRACPPDTCTRFTREDAELLASGVTNGHGEKGKAIHINDALREHLGEYDKVLETLGA